MEGAPRHSTRSHADLTPGKSCHLRRKRERKLSMRDGDPLGNCQGRLHRNHRGSQAPIRRSDFLAESHCSYRAVRGSGRPSGHWVVGSSADRTPRSVSLTEGGIGFEWRITSVRHAHLRQSHLEAHVLQIKREGCAHSIDAFSTTGTCSHPRTPGAQYSSVPTSAIPSRGSLSMSRLTPASTPLSIAAE